VSEPICAKCDSHVAPDGDHVKVDAESVWMEYRNDRDIYYFHTDCFREVPGNWSDPA